MLWDKIEGHQDVKNSLMHQIEAGRIGHAYLFVGTHGIGKKLVARAFASKVLCKDDLKTIQPLSCEERVQKAIHPDLRIWQTEKKSFSVKEIRSWQKDLWLPPTLASYKVTIIDEAEKLTLQAQNALLKLLEEPPSNIVFILTCCDTSNILTTIQSRCRKVRFNNLKANSFEKILCSEITDDKLLKFLFYLTKGSPGQALSLNEKLDIKQVRDQLNKICDLLNNNNIDKMFVVVADIIKKENEVEIILLMLETIWAMALRQDNRINDIIDNSAKIMKRPIWVLKQDCKHIINAQKQIQQYQNKQLVLETLLLYILEDIND
ncbi:AAA family ATPase [Clostridium sp. 'deep sea']|uniref:DNA polymerase III subunit n=1 Tax=Clostridium sp. 'deep sea' TaxID=2779445 RepID=UPI00189699E9|nr:AAA family ATPase [Clostridium sp. 'deep sea']QOR34496.1 AAA family ATPase [Clostridium sp. 'deep sea']